MQEQPEGGVSVSGKIQGTGHTAANANLGERQVCQLCLPVPPFPLYVLPKVPPILSHPWDNLRIQTLAFQAPSGCFQKVSPTALATSHEKLGARKLTCCCCCNCSYALLDPRELRPASPVDG